MLKSSNWMQKEIALVEVKPNQKPQEKSPKELCSALQPPALLFFRNYMNDSLRTDVFVRFQPESIACACIYLAARTLEVSHTLMDLGFFSRPFNRRRNLSFVSLSPFQIPLPNRPHWFLLFGATEEEIQEICLKILQLYTRKKVWFFFHVGSPQWRLQLRAGVGKFEPVQNHSCKPGSEQRAVTVWDSLGFHSPPWEWVTRKLSSHKLCSCVHRWIYLIWKVK